jgi:hypothetical protein
MWNGIDQDEGSGEDEHGAEIPLVSRYIARRVWRLAYAALDAGALCRRP